MRGRLKALPTFLFNLLLHCVQFRFARQGMPALLSGPDIIYLKIRYQRQVVGGHERCPTPMKQSMVQLQAGVEIYVVQVEKRDNARVCARAPQMGSGVDAAKTAIEYARGQAARPLIEVAANNSNTMEPRIPQNVGVDKFPRLSPAFKETGTQMYVEQMECGFSNFDVGAQAAAALPPLGADVMIPY